MVDSHGISRPVSTPPDPEMPVLLTPASFARRKLPTPPSTVPAKASTRLVFARESGKLALLLTGYRRIPENSLKLSIANAVHARFKQNTMFSKGLEGIECHFITG